MSGKKSQLTPLETRKQILLTESELNRIQFLHEWNELKGEIRRMTNPLQVAGAFISSAAGAGAVFSVLRRICRRKNKTDGKKSWISSLLNGLKVGALLWTLFHRGGRQS